MRLSLYEFETGVETVGGDRAVYDIANDSATFGAANVEGHGARLATRRDARGGGRGPSLSSSASSDPYEDWVLRCDRVDFPPGGVAYTHTHPGPGIRYLLHGEIDIRTEGKMFSYGKGGAWFESGPDPVLATASGHQPTAFVRVLHPPGRMVREAHDPLRRSG